MEKAYDVAELLKRVKEKGGPALEQFAEAELAMVADEIVVWAEQSAALTPMPYDDMAVAVLKAPVEKIKEAIKKIDIDGDGQ